MNEGGLQLLVRTRRISNSENYACIQSMCKCDIPRKIESTFVVVVYKYCCFYRGNLPTIQLYTYSEEFYSMPFRKVLLFSFFSAVPIWQCYIHEKLSSPIPVLLLKDPLPIYYSYLQLARSFIPCVSFCDIFPLICLLPQ